MLHGVMILGSYAPNHVMSGLTSFEIFQNISSDVETATYNDSYFYFKVLPQIKDVAKYMCIVNLVLCAIRLLSFIIAHVPMIVIERQNTEEEQQEQQEEQEMQGLEISNSVGENETSEEVVEDVGEEEETSGATEGKDKKKKKKKRRRRSRRSGAVKLALIVMSSGSFIYEVFFFLFALAAVIADAPLFTTFTFLEVVSFLFLCTAPLSSTPPSPRR